MAKKKSNDKVVLTLTLEEAKQLVINLSGQNGIDGLKIFKESAHWFGEKSYKDDVLFDVFNKLVDNLADINVDVGKPK